MRDNNTPHVSEYETKPWAHADVKWSHDHGPYEYGATLLEVGFKGFYWRTYKGQVAYTAFHAVSTLFVGEDCVEVCEVSAQDQEHFKLQHPTMTGNEIWHVLTDAMETGNNTAFIAHAYAEVSCDE